LTLKHDNLLSNFAFNCNLRPSNKESIDTEWAVAARDAEARVARMHEVGSAADNALSISPYHFILQGFLILVS